MSDNLESNPFLGLFGSAQEVTTFLHPQEHVEELSPSGRDESASKSSSLKDDQSPSISDEDKIAINSIIGEVFCITISRKVSSMPMVIVEETASCLDPQDTLDVSNLEQALFERLLLDEPGNHVIRPTASQNLAVNHHVVETEVLTYLFECHKRLTDLKKSQAAHLVQKIVEMDNLVIRNVATALTQPELYGSQHLHTQFLGMLNDYDNEHLTSLLSSVVNTILTEEGQEQGLNLLTAAFNPVLDEIRDCAKQSSLATLNRHHLYLIEFFSTNPTLGHILVTHSTPSATVRDGSKYRDTLFGAILATSCLPRYGLGYQASDQPQFDPRLESVYHTGLKFICDSMHTVFFNLFKTSLPCRHALLSWIGKCLQANAPRGQVASLAEELAEISSISNVSDGFMLNLEGVLLRLCKPFISRDALPKILKVDPTYCAAEVSDDAEANEKWVHLMGMTSETCLIPWNPDSESESRPSARSFNFVTEIFFMTHRALDLGAQVVFERWMQLARNLAMVQQQMETNLARLPNVAERLRQGFDQEMTRSILIRTALLEPSTLSLMGDFYSATAEWLVQVAIHPVVAGEQETYAPLNFLPLSFPLSETIPITLSCIPEFLIENVVCYQSMVHRSVPHELEGKGVQFLEPLLSLVLVFMGSKQHMRNPHLRARLAECLESLVPHNVSEDDSPARNVPSINREILFKNHPHRVETARCLLDVFVSIEVTGESVSFEQKFQYRRPMYLVMDYLWTIVEQRTAFKTLAAEAEADMTAVNPPLFLRFIYLLLNDAVFLLDEALSNMAQLKNLQNARDNGEWDNLPPRERQQNEGNLAHVGRIARFDNILGKETIHTLECLTREITSIFCDPILVDRIASTLNYFLVHLVGPKMKNFKVRDQEEYKFKPADLVMDICRIYINLGKSEAFCLAVSQDGRSYNSMLFIQAEKVLVRIGGGVLISDLRRVASRVAELALQQDEEDEALAEAPDEFYDPILSTLMSDPVILPSSKTTCDRSTIAKHLLSDQTDPFTKAPLTMAQVIPDVELKKRIEAWRNERHSLRASAAASEAAPNLDDFSL